MVTPGGIIGTARGESTLLHKLQATKKEAASAGAKSLAKTLKASSRLQGISEEGEQGEEVRIMKGLQSQKARIKAQMVPAQLRVPPPRSITESPFEDAETVAPAQGERRVRVRTKEILGMSHLHKLRISAGADDDMPAQDRQAVLLLLLHRRPLPRPPKINGFDAVMRTRRASFSVTRATM